MYFQFHFGTETGDMFLIGLTGGIATGKSTVSKLFQELGCPVLDADLIAREGDRYILCLPQQRLKK